MSLINDALKRAKEAQEDAPAPVGSGPPLRPVEPEQLTRHGVGLVLPIALACLALLMLFFVWRYAPRSRASDPSGQVASALEARARVLPTERTPAVAPAPAPPAEPEPVENSVSKGHELSTPAPAASAQPVESSPVSIHSDVASSGVPGNSPTVVAPQPPKPAVPRLQGIVFNPRRPSAVINGKVMFRGDRIAGFRLVAIGPDSATLVSATQTNVLMMEE